MTHPAIEAAAMAMCDHDLWPGAWIKANEVETRNYHRRARVAILSFLDAVQKPAPGMVDAAYHEASMQGYWQAMLAALRAEVAGEGSK